MRPLFARPIRSYVDTSVFGGCFDAPFETASLRFFSEVKQGRFLALISDLTLAEISGAPGIVQDVYRALPSDRVQRVPIDQAVLDLMRAYLQADILTPRSEADATHVAAASVSGADLLISWNFRDLVHVEKIRGFHAINIIHGYPTLDIRSPWEVLHED